MDKEILIKLIDEGKTQRQIAEHFGKSQTSARFNLKKYGLSTKKFEDRKIIDGLRYCSKCKEPRNISDFYKHSKKTKKRVSVCKSCTIRTITDKRVAFKIECVQYKGGKCEACGYDKCVAAFDFHHRDPKEKDFSISEVSHRNIDLVKKELDKCNLLCSNCHREEHDRLYKQTRDAS